MADLDVNKFKVVKAKSRDAGKFIVRINSVTMEELKIRTGNYINIKGKRVSAAIAWPAYPNDQEHQIIRMDKNLRENVDVGLGEIVTIIKAEEKIAKRVLIAPTSVNIKPDPYIEDFIRKKYLNYPLIKNDKMYISIGISKKVPFKVLYTDPIGTVIVKQSTILRVIEKSIVDEYGLVMDKNFKSYITTNKLDYIQRGKMEDCIFCQIELLKDLLVFENEIILIVLNKYPYNPGHLMIIPKQHVEDIEDLTEQDLIELFTGIKKAKRVLKKIYDPLGFNIGLNLGEAAGGSISHLHIHVVPRYKHELNFLEVTSGTRVIVEKLEDTHKKIYEEFKKL